MSNQTPPERIAELEDRIEQLEATIRKMLPGRRDAMKLGGAAVIGAAAMSGTASAGSSQVGTIGSPSSLIDVEAEDINVSDTITTQDLVVNGTATGSFGGGVVFEDGDSITEHRTHVVSVPPNTFETIFNVSPAVDVYGGAVYGLNPSILRITFGSSSTTTLGSNDDFDVGEALSGDRFGVHPIWPMKNVQKIEFRNDDNSSRRYGYQVFTT